MKVVEAKKKRMNEKRKEKLLLKYKLINLILCVMMWIWDFYYTHEDVFITLFSITQISFSSFTLWPWSKPITESSLPTVAVTGADEDVDGAEVGFLWRRTHIVGLFVMFHVPVGGGGMVIYCNWEFGTTWNCLFISIMDEALINEILLRFWLGVCRCWRGF